MRTMRTVRSPAKPVMVTSSSWFTAERISKTASHHEHSLEPKRKNELELENVGSIWWILLTCGCWSSWMFDPTFCWHNFWEVKLVCLGAFYQFSAALECRSLQTLRLQTHKFPDSIRLGETLVAQAKSFGLPIYNYIYIYIYPLSLSLGFVHLKHFCLFMGFILLAPKRVVKNKAKCNETGPVGPRSTSNISK